MSNKVNGMGTLLLGMLSGVVLGVMYAPKAGKKTREELSNWLDAKRESSTEVLEEWRSKLPEQREKIAAAIKSGTDVFAKNGRKKTTVKS
jgi:gas vesicle protein